MDNEDRKIIALALAVILIGNAITIWKLSGIEEKMDSLKKPPRPVSVVVYQTPSMTQKEVQALCSRLLAEWKQPEAILPTLPGRRR